MTLGLARPEFNAEEITGRRIALLSMSVGAGLAAAKIWVGLNAGSTSVVSDGFEAAGDVLSSGIVYAGLWLASKPPDYEHPYGHGRYETLAGLAVGAMLLLAGAGIFWNGVISLGRPAQVAGFALYPLLAAVFIKSALAGFKLRVGKRIASASLEADAWHDITDLLSTCVALAAVILSSVGRALDCGSIGQGFEPLPRYSTRSRPYFREKPWTSFIPAYRAGFAIYCRRTRWPVRP
jgi:cation diffusion facilitator family transporter